MKQSHIRQAQYKVHNILEVLPRQVLNTEVNAMTLTYLFTFKIKKYSTICIRIILL